MTVSKEVVDKAPVMTFTTERQRNLNTSYDTKIFLIIAVLNLVSCFLTILEELRSHLIFTNILEDN